MTMMTENVAFSRARIDNGITAAIRQWTARTVERWRFRRDMKRLSLLRQHLLRDIGLERFAAPPEPTIQKPWQ